MAWPACQSRLIGITAKALALLLLNGAGETRSRYCESFAYMALSVADGVTPMTSPAPYKLFNVTLLRKAPLSPSLWRFTFGGAEVASMNTCAVDERIKIFLPDAEGRPPALPDAPDWYATYKAQDPALRPPMRTYTIRQLRAEAAELDIDFVLHGETGPASTWATHAKPGARLQITAPNAAH